MASKKYQPIYELLAREGYEPEGTIVWQRNRWRLQVWKGSKLYKLAMSGAKEELEEFHKKIHLFINYQKAKNATA